MYRFISYLVVILIFFVSCNKTQEKVESFKIEYINDVELSIPSNFYNIPRYSKFIKTDTCTYFIEYARKHLFFYNLDSNKLLQEIYIPNAHFVEIHNLDSIFVLEHNTDFVYDSSLFLINHNGEILKYYSLKNAPVLFSENNLYSSDSVAYINGIYYYKNKLFLFFDKLFYDNINDSAYCSVKIPIAGYIDTKINKFTPIDLYQYPDLPNKKQINRTNAIVFPIATGNILYLGFNYTSEIIKYDIISNEKTIISPKSYFIDSINPSINTKAFNSPQAYVGFLYLEKYNQYLRYCLLNTQEPIKQSCMILDSSFNLIGEYSADVLPTNIIGDVFYYYNTEKTFSSDKKIVFSKYSLSEKEILLDSLLNNFKLIVKTPDNCNVAYKSDNYCDIDFLGQYLYKKLQKDNFKVIILPIFESCHTCVDYLLKMFYINAKYYSQSDVYLIAVGDNQAAIIEKLHQFNISENMENVIVDSSYNYIKSFKNFTLEHFVIVKNNKIIFTQDYYPDNLDSLISKTFEK